MPSPLADDDPDPPHDRRLPRPWTAVLLGAATGFAAAGVGILLWTLVRGWSSPDLPPRRETARIDLFRLPSGGAREALLVPAGPDASGEPALVAALFPGADPAPELVALLLANVAPRPQPGQPEASWDVDLAAEPLRCRAGDAAWQEISRLDGAPTQLPPAADLRFRALGGGGSHVVVEPGTSRQVLLALPPGRKLADLTDVEWGGRALTRDRLELERLRRFREDPAGTMTGR